MNNLSLEQVMLMYNRHQTLIHNAFWQHISLVYTSVLIGTSIAVPLGIVLTRHHRLGQQVLAFMSILQTVPSLVMFGLLIPLTGIGRHTAIIVLSLYSILPILRNTYTGISEVPPDYIEAATGMGMSSAQTLLQVELPIALPAIVTGIRLSSVYIVSWATIAGLIGAGGLGDVIQLGIGRFNHALILLGAVPSCFLAILTSYVIGRIAHMVTPAGLRRARQGGA